MHTIDTYLWLTSSLLVLGILLIPLGLSFLFLPEKMERIGERLNNWISTEHIFDSLNKPRYQERLFYRFHHLFGGLVIVFALISIYMLYFYTDIKPLIQNIVLMADTAFGKWLLESLYYILLGANILALVIGVIIFFRPSLMKEAEKKSNYWVETEEKLKVLDKTKDLPDTVLSGNPRIFGALILLGAIYIIVNTKHILM